MRLRRVILIHIVALIIATSAIWAESEVDTKIAKSFKTNWDSIQYNQTLYNPDIPSNSSIPKESLRLSCGIEVLDPNKTLGTCRYGVITELVVGKDRKINVHRYTPDNRQMYYEGLRYHDRYIQPPVPPRWQILLRRLLRLQLPKYPRPQLVNELQPSEMNMQLEVGLLGSNNKEISSIKGYFYAVTTESIEYIDVPFEPNVNWVSLTPDINIQVRQANCSTTATRLSYNFNIVVDKSGSNSMNRLLVGDSLPGRIVIDRQLIGKDGKPFHPYRTSRQLPANIGGNSSGSSSDSDGVSPIEKIRFVIAVNPTHHKIPFELKNIPLPNPPENRTR